LRRRASRCATGEATGGVVVIDRDELGRRLCSVPALEALLPALRGIDSIHLVGGAVRDLLLGRQPLDLDLVVEGDAAAVAVKLAGRLGGTVVEHERFGTATLAAETGTFDIAGARTESYPRPGALPEVAAATLAADLARRDFTVHAIAAALSEGALGELQAAPGALEDLDAQTLRVLHDGSFLDDPTRLLRLVRYESRLQFTVAPETDRLAREAIASGAPATVSRARLGDELRPLLAERGAFAALARARGLGLLAALHGDLALDSGVAEAALAHLPADGRAELLVLATCCTRFARGDLRAWLDSLEFTAAERDPIVAAALDAPALAAALSAARAPSQIAAAARSHTVEEVALAGALGAGEAANAWLGELRHVQLEIGGDDLIAAGVHEGPAIGHALQAALARKLDGALSGPEAELQAALQAAGARGPG